MYDLDALISQARSYLAGKGCAHSTIAHHGAAWKRLRSWCGNEGVKGCDHDVERRLIEEAAMSNANATKYFKLDRRRALPLPSIEETGGPRRGGRRGGSSSRRASATHAMPTPQASRAGG